MTKITQAEILSFLSSASAEAHRRSSTHTSIDKQAWDGVAASIDKLIRRCADKRVVEGNENRNGRTSA